MLMDLIACAIAIGAGLALPWTALRACPACGYLARRTQRPSHHCPSRRYTILTGMWVGAVVLWALAAVVGTVGPGSLSG